MLTWSLIGRRFPQTGNKVTMKIVPVPRMLYGTSFPFCGSTEVDEGLGACGFRAADLRVINRDDVLRLFPGLKA